MGRKEKERGESVSVSRGDFSGSGRGEGVCRTDSEAGRISDLAVENLSIEGACSEDAELSIVPNLSSPSRESPECNPDGGPCRRWRWTIHLVVAVDRCCVVASKKKGGSGDG